MNLEDRLKTILSLLRERPAMISEKELKSPVKALEKAATQFLNHAATFDGVDFSLLIEARAAIKAISGTAAVAEVNRRLTRFGIKIQGKATEKAAIALQIARSAQAAAIIAEIRLRPQDIVREEFYALVRLPEQALFARLEALNDKELEALIKKHGGTIKKSGKGKKLSLDRETTLRTFIQKIEKERLATQ